MKIVITLIKIVVLTILLLSIFAGGVCVVLGANEPAVASIGLVSILLFGWPAWLIGKSLIGTGDSESKDDAPPTDPAP